MHAVATTISITTNDNTNTNTNTTNNARVSKGCRIEGGAQRGCFVLNNHARDWAR